MTTNRRMQERGHMAEGQPLIACTRSCPSSAHTKEPEPETSEFRPQGRVVSFRHRHSWARLIVVHAYVSFQLYYVQDGGERGSYLGEAVASLAGLELELPLVEGLHGLLGLPLGLQQ